MEIIQISFQPNLHRVVFLPGAANGLQPLQGFVVVADIPLVPGHGVILALVRDPQNHPVQNHDSSSEDGDLDDAGDSNSDSSNDDRDERDGHDAEDGVNAVDAHV